MAKLDPLALKISLSAIPTSTTMSAPGTTFRFLRKATLLNAIRMTNEIKLMLTAPKCE